ncbi:acylphosphatase [Marispirochaeta aestuarii]|uniref:acylphosphatase n=1 Tax=Marispirochaeta aestuarii TaxID=1963862 RepID=UPI0029C645C8|nr:acylphosphatase [Marispirochaeta aestuarii]
MGTAEGSACRFTVHGRVQGVGFRYSTVRRAQTLRLAGYVRNRADGSVEVWAEGTAGALDSLYAWLQRGPSMARVDRVDRDHFAPSGRYRGFSVTY